MSKAIGRDYKVGISREGSGLRGTASAPQFWTPHSSFDFDDKVLTITDEQSYGVIENSVDVQIVKKWAEGTLEGRVRDKAIGLMLLNTLGVVSTSDDTPESGVYTHTFTVGQNNQHPSLTISVDDPVAGDKAYSLAMIKKLDIKAELEEAIMFSADVISKTSSATTLTPAYAAENIFTAVDMEVGFAATAAALGSAVYDKIKSVSISIDTGVEKDDILGQYDPDDIHNKSLGITIEITKAYENTTYKDYYKEATGKAMRVKMEGEDTTIGTTSHPKLQFDFNQIKVIEWSKSTDLDGIVIETFTLKANFKIADAKMVQAVLVNTQDSYNAEIAGGELGVRAEIATP
jgi:hypothetical protein